MAHANVGAGDYRVHATDPALRTPAELRRQMLEIFPYISLPMFLAIVDQTMVATALPSIVADLGHAERSSLLVIAYVCASAITTPVYGQLGDRFGRVRLMRIALMIFAGAGMWCALSASMHALLAARIAQGIGAGGLIGLSQALIGERVSPRERGRMQGYLATVVITSTALGPLIGGFGADYAGWRWLFGGASALGLLALAITSRLPSARAPTSDSAPFRFDIWGLVLFATLVVTVLSALQMTQTPEPATASPWLWLALPAAAALLLLLARRERRASQPLLPPDLIALPAVWRSDLLAIFFAAALVSLMTFLPLFFRVAHGATPAGTGLLMLPAVLGIGIGGIVTGRLIWRTGRTAIWPSLGLTIAAFLLVALAVALPGLSASQVGWLVGIASIFMGSVMSVVQVTVQIAAGPDRLGMAAATVQLSRTLGAALGTALVGAALFGTLASMGPQIYAGFLELIADASTGPHTALRGPILDAFRIAFSLPAAFAVAGLILAWTLPVRRI